MDLLKVLAISLALCMGLVGCTSTGRHQQAGTAIGAGSGAVIGALVARGSGANAFAGAAIGGIIGGLIGGSIGASLDARERRELAAASRYAASKPAGQKVAWRAPSSQRGARPTTGTVTPGKIYKKPNGGECRDLDRVANKDGRTVRDSVTACRTASGWSVPTG